MLGEIKKNISGDNLREVSQNLENLRENNEKELDNLKNELKITKQSYSQLQNDVMQLLTLTQQANNSTQRLQDQLEQSMTDLKLVSSSIQNTVLQRITDDFAELRKTMEEKLGGSEALKKEVELTSQSIVSELAQLQQEIGKLSTVAGNIKREDFELNKVAKHLISEDKEKLRLMNEVDRLQRLVGSMRRKTH